MDELRKLFASARAAAGDAIAMLKHHTFQALLDAIDQRLSRLEEQVGVVAKAADAAVAAAEGQTQQQQG